ncbi:unnamed protein product [Clonostachys byssicola]|uniref:Uncharacterized protein n=1 Tax=Clonostachys byssicola TaxID=160290 RepID=A0A9N9V1A5_9HYPO|nr:unnamed protein product [Clonostachys byssicola]
MDSTRRNSMPSTGPWMTSAIPGNHMDVAEARSSIGGSSRSSGSGEVINHFPLGYDFTRAFMSPVYPYLRDAQIVYEQLYHFYHDQSPSNDEVRHWLGDINDIRRRDIFINCFIRHLWQQLGVWNDNWSIPGLSGYQDNIGNWIWRWREGEDQLDLLAADRDQTHRARVRKATRMVFTKSAACKQTCISKNATVAEAEEFLSSRPWFMHGVQVAGKGDTPRASQRVKTTWRIQRRWMPEWDYYNPGWRWDGDETSIANPKFLLNLLTDNEKRALGLQENLTRPLRHWGRYSLPAAQSSRTSDIRYVETPRGRRTSHTSSQRSPKIGHNQEDREVSEGWPGQRPTDDRCQASAVCQRFSEAYFARSYSQLAFSSAADLAQTLVDEDKEEEIREAISPVPPRIRMSIENFKLGLCPDQFIL